MTTVSVTLAVEGAGSALNLELLDSSGTVLAAGVSAANLDQVINDHFGDALWMVGRRNEAVFQWKRALSFEPEEKDAERIRRKLELGLDKVLAEEQAAGKPAIIGVGGALAGQNKNGG